MIQFLVMRAKVEGSLAFFPVMVHRFLMCFEKFSNAFLAVGYFLLGGVTGWLAWGGSDAAVWPLVWILVLPLAWGFSGSRWSVFLLMIGYFLASARGLPGGTAVFFGDSAPVWFGVLMWGAACFLLALPFVLFWSSKAGSRAWRFVLAVCVSAVPPLAIVGWVSPLAVAGVVFPDLGWAGLVLTFGFMAALVSRSRRWFAVFFVMSVSANGMMFLVDREVPAGWRGVDTAFSRLSSAGSDDAGMVLAAMQRVQWVADFAKSVPEDAVVVLPETVLGSFDGVASLALQKTEAALRARRARILVGAELLQSDARFKNVVMVLGAEKAEDRFAVQNVPVPVAMWHPWAPGGAVANVFGRGNMVRVRGLRAGVLVCYEQLLAYSFFWSMLERPDVVVAVSNVWWARGTSIPAIQRQTVSAFGRLFGVGVVMAQNR